jgi:hypothetical protein
VQLTACVYETSGRTRSWGGLVVHFASDNMMSRALIDCPDKTCSLFSLISQYHDKSLKYGFATYWVTVLKLSSRHHIHLFVFTCDHKKIQVRR